VRADQWIAEVAKIEAGCARGFTTRELADYASKSIKGARQIIQAGIKAGLIRHAGFKNVPDISGRVQKVPAFEAVKGQKV
jgi:hypothetical protein